MSDASMNEKNPTRAGLGRSLLVATVALACTLVLLVGLSMLVYPKNNTEDAGMYEAVANGVQGEPDNSLDVLFVGDSEVFCDISPMQMWTEQGFTSYDVATKAQRIYYGNELLHVATQRQRPRIVVLETDSLYGRRRVSISAALMTELGRVLPVFEYHDRWKELTLADLTTTFEHTGTAAYKGYMLRWGVNGMADEAWIEDDEEDDEEDVEDSKSAHVSRVARFYLAWMISYCRSIGATPILLSSPSPSNMSTARHNAIQKLADEHDVAYLDLNEHMEEIGLDWTTDTFDSGEHVNVFGAAKVSSYVGAWLASEYDLPDHRGDPTYASWDEIYTQYYDEVTSSIEGTES